MSRYFVTFALVGVVIMWLVLSYAPVSLPSIALDSPSVLAWFPALAVILLGVFAVGQLDLVRATVKMIRRPVGVAERESIQVLGLTVGREVFLTALPLLATLLLIFALNAK